MRHVVRSISLVLVIFFSASPLPLGETDFVLAETYAPNPPQPLISINPLSNICGTCDEKDGYLPQYADLEVSSQKSFLKELSLAYYRDPRAAYAYFQMFAERREVQTRASARIHRNALNSIYIKPKVEGRDEIRLMWTAALGVDVWYPYFKVKEIEKKVKKKISFKIFKMKCTPKFQKGLFVYICKKTF